MTDLDLRAIGEGLPFAETLDDLRAAVTTRGVAVVQAPPGSGKTTLAPPVVADCVDGRVVVTGPRRVTVRAAARRLAHLTGTQVGDLVGHTVRGERRVGPRTRVEFVTPGVLVRRLLAEVGHPVESLVRTRFGSVALGDQRAAGDRALRHDRRLHARQQTGHHPRRHQVAVHRLRIQTKLRHRGLAQS